MESIAVGCFSTLPGKLDGRTTLAAATQRQSRQPQFDERLGQFEPDPTGPFEGQPDVHDKPTSDKLFRSRQEIKLKDRRGIQEPVTSYVDHYPGHPGEARQCSLGAAAPPQTRFNAASEYDREFGWKTGEARPLYTEDGEGAAAGAVHSPFMGRTTYGTFHTGYPVSAKPGRSLLQPSGAAIDEGSFAADTFTTTNAATHVPFPVQRRPGPTCALARPQLPWLAGETTAEAELKAKRAAPLGLASVTAPIILTPLDAETEYQGEFVAKAGDPPLAHLAGTCTADGGLALPWPRKSLGVQFWSRGEADRVYCMLPHSVPAPCSASQVFTTVHDDEETATIVIHYGEGTRTDNTHVLGQLDLTGIPPAPRDVPRIEVRFVLDSGNRLSVTVRDMDTQRQKDWLQRGGVSLRANHAAFDTPEAAH